jgi:hypothetical protein
MRFQIVHGVSLLVAADSPVFPISPFPTTLTFSNPFASRWKGLPQTASTDVVAPYSRSGACWQCSSVPPGRIALRQFVHPHSRSPPGCSGRSLPASLIGRPGDGWRFRAGCSIGRPARPGMLAPLHMLTLRCLPPWLLCCRMGRPFRAHHRNCRIQAQYWALTTRIGEMSMPRPPTAHHNPRQFDLFGDPPYAAAPTPQWQALPAETRHTLRS